LSRRSQSFGRYRVSIVLSQIIHDTSIRLRDDLAQRSTLGGGDRRASAFLVPDLTAISSSLRSAAQAAERFAASVTKAERRRCGATSKSTHVATINRFLSQRCSCVCSTHADPGITIHSGRLICKVQKMCTSSTACLARIIHEGAQRGRRD